MYFAFYLTILSIVFVACTQEAPTLSCKKMDQNGVCLDGAQTSAPATAATPQPSGMTPEQLIQVLGALQSRNNQPPVVVGQNDTVEQYVLKTEQYWQNLKNQLLEEKRTTTSQKRLGEIDQEIAAIDIELGKLRAAKENPPSNWGHNANQVCQAVLGSSCLGGALNLGSKLIDLIPDKKTVPPQDTGALGPYVPCTTPQC